MLKFQFAIIGATGDLKLLDVIDFTAKVTVPELEVPYGSYAYIMENYELDLLKGLELADGTYLTEYVIKPGESFGPIVISGHMDKDAGNEYQGLKVTGLAINIVATQAMAESDSINNSYDMDAMYAVANDLYIDQEDGSYVAFNTKGLQSAAALANNDASITSVTYITDEGEVEVLVVSDDDSNALDNAIKSGNDIVVLTAGTYTVDEAKGMDSVTIVGTKDSSVAASNEGENGVDYGFDGSNVTFVGVTIDTTNQSGTYRGYARAEITFNDCTFVGTYTVFGNTVFNNCDFDTKNNYVWATWGASKVEFNNCIFNSDVAKAILLHGRTSSEVIIKDCTFTAKTAAYTWDKLYVAAVSADPVDGATYNIKFIGTNTVITADDATADGFGNIAYAGLHQVKYAEESAQVTYTINGTTVENIIAVKYE